MKSGLVMVAFKMVGDVVALKSSLVMVAFEECLRHSLPQLKKYVALLSLMSLGICESLPPYMIYMVIPPHGLVWVLGWILNWT